MDINVNIYDAGPQINVDVQDVGAEINVKVESTGEPGKDGKDGFSPTIKVKEDTATKYILEIENEDGKFETPNLKAPDSSWGYEIGNGLKLDKDTNTLSVNTSNDVNDNNTLPITSAAVFTTVGNIEVLLGTI